MTSTAIKNRPAIEPEPFSDPIEDGTGGPPTAPVLDEGPVLVARMMMRTLCVQMKARFRERDDLIDGLALALIAGEHVLAIGDPGTAKSDVVREFCNALEDPTRAPMDSAAFFYTLCNRFQTPDEIFGPLSLPDLQAGRFVRVTRNRMPEALIVMLDEVFKGSSALLNSTLAALNERTFEQNGQVKKMPVRMFVAASNELPDAQDGLAAFHDRFLLRYDVKRLQADENTRDVLFEAIDAAITQRIPLEQLDLLAAAVHAIPVANDARVAILKIRAALHEAHVRVSDRRWKKAVKLLRAQALLAGRTAVTSASLGILEACCWERPEQIPTVEKIVREHVATWLKTTRDAQGAVDEQLARIQEAKRSGGKRSDAITQLARALEKLTEVDKSMDDVVVQHPDAAAEVDVVRKRIGVAKDAALESMKILGIGLAGG